MTFRTVCALLFTALLAAGCGGGDASAGNDGSRWALDSTAVLEIGALEGDSLYQLFRVRGVAELPDGSMAVANSGTYQVRIYDATGTFVRSFGRQGGGPGEFEALADVFTRGDTVLTFDRRNARLTRFLVDGTYLGDVTVRAGSTALRPGVAGLLVSSGEIVAWSSSGPPQGNGLVRDTVSLLRFAADGALLDTLGRFAGDEMAMQIEGAQGNITSISIMSLPFYREFLAVTSGDRTYAGANDSALVHAFGADGTVATVRWDDAPRPLDDAYLEAYLEDASAETDSAAARQRTRDRVMDSPRPPTRPVFDQLRAGPDGEVWVRRFGEPGEEQREWLVFSPDGERLATLRLHRDVDIHAVGRERVYTVERDEYDVEYVRGYTLRR